MTMSQKAWYDKAFVCISMVGGAEFQLHAKTTNLNISGGGFDIEGIETFGGKITRIGTKDDIEISLEGIPTSLVDFDWIFAGQTAQPSFSTTGSALSSSVNTKCRLTFLWTNQTGITSAVQAITSSNEAYRRVYAEAYMTSHPEISMDAGDRLNAKMAFKLANEDDTGAQNWATYAKDTTSGTLSAVPAYTTTLKF